jgi:hypothetical protein
MFSTGKKPDFEVTRKQLDTNTRTIDLCCSVLHFYGILVTNWTFYGVRIDLTPKPS